MNTFEDVFLTELEPLTDDLMDELEAQGWERERLQEAANAGLAYNRVRDSFMREGGLGGLTEEGRREVLGALEYKRDLGRNDPCWCGSGKKYKHCHWREDNR